MAIDQSPDGIQLMLDTSNVSDILNLIDSAALEKRVYTPGELRYRDIVGIIQYSKEEDGRGILSFIEGDLSRDRSKANEFKVHGEYILGDECPYDGPVFLN